MRVDVVGEDGEAFGGVHARGDAWRVPAGLSRWTAAASTSTAAAPFRVGRLAFRGAPALQTECAGPVEATRSAPEILPAHPIHRIAAPRKPFACAVSHPHQRSA
ncbi:MAG: hypothetical protein ACK52I_01580 [Pseudomonadota bacterium]